ncbi:hypothetical protein SAMN05880582_101317 [Rhizobium sp. RU20A]|nr:hypothetical protein SAMN05880582_101317 [Rhizobium sp. RU20A]
MKTACFAQQFIKWRRPKPPPFTDYSMIEATMPAPRSDRATLYLGPAPSEHFECRRQAFGPPPLIIDYSMIEATMPAPTVRPPSRIAKRSFSSIAIGTISSTATVTLSPGMTISVPSGSVTIPVTSVVRK